MFKQKVWQSGFLGAALCVAPSESRVTLAAIISTQEPFSSSKLLASVH